MEELSIHIERITTSQQIPFDLLELADPSRTQIDSYLATGTCFVAKLESEIVAVMVLDKVNLTTTEIKNIAVSVSLQGKGIGKILLRYAVQVSRESGYKTLIIGTGNSSVGQLAVYQKEGFEVERIEKDYFIKNYDKPIFENGIQCKHMIVLKKEL